ncbi:MAG TPA: hypothetical protein VK639_14160 [Terriglobales bacterium]|nr:hypothetical protein [Terriglobales bacterium]
MASDLLHQTRIFDPELDLEHIPELPGKDVMQDAIQTLTTSGIRCSKAIQDSHGWCFYLWGDDARKYLLELSYVCTQSGTSKWVLWSRRCCGWRRWELPKSEDEAKGREQHYLDAVTNILLSHHAYEIQPT